MKYGEGGVGRCSDKVDINRVMIKVCNRAKTTKLPTMGKGE